MAKGTRNKQIYRQKGLYKRTLFLVLWWLNMKIKFNRIYSLTPCGNSKMSPMKIEADITKDGVFYPRQIIKVSGKQYYKMEKERNYEIRV